MASPQIENGHIDIANTIADKFCSYRLSGQEWQVVWVVLRKTWGWKKKIDKISLSQFETLTGIDRRKIHVLLKKLVAKKVIERTDTQKDDRNIVKYGLCKDFDIWKLTPKKMTVKTDTQRDDKVTPKEMSKLTPKEMNTKDNKDNKQKTYSENLKKFTADFIKYTKKTFPKKTPTGVNHYQNSLDSLDKLIRLDGFDEEYVFKIIRWAAKDDFWESQVISLAGLRKKNDAGLTKFQNIVISHDKKIKTEKVYHIKTPNMEDALS